MKRIFTLGLACAGLAILCAVILESHFGRHHDTPAAPQVPLQSSQQQSLPAPPDDTDDIPRSKEGNMILEVTDLLYAAQDASLRPDIEGKTIEITGQLMLDGTDNPNGNRFKLARMLDTQVGWRPAWVWVENPVKPAGAAMSWIKVVGTAEFSTEGGRILAVVKASKVEAVDPPKETALY